MTNTLNASSSLTMKAKKTIPEDRLLCEQVEQCRHCWSGGSYMSPNCSCQDPEYKPFEEQTLSSLFGSEGIHVYIPKILLQGHHADDVCYEMQKQMNVAFGAQYDNDKKIDVLLVEPEPYEDGINPRIVFAASVGDRVWRDHMLTLRGALRQEIVAFANLYLSNLKAAVVLSQGGCSMIGEPA